MADVNRLVFSIIRFLEDQKTAANLSDEGVEGLEVAIQCLESTYSVSTQDPQQVKKLSVPKNLLDIFNSQLSSEPEAEFDSLSIHEPTPEEKEEAECLKNKGNEFMKAEKFSDALECYTQALKLDSHNSVFFCNRAAAYSKLNKHVKAIEDCEKALTIDPQYSKAYGRMGIAYTALNDHESALECYRKALELDPTNQSYQNNLEIAEQKLKEEAAKAGFGLGSGGGMPMDFSQILNNPHVMDMATQMMGNPQMQQMMSNMMSGFGGVPGAGGGNPEEAVEGGAPGVPGGIGNILQIGQQMASQMQESNPELVAQLRQQMGRPPNNPDGSNDADSNPGSQQQ
ncbi:small glutamine-rich tetratricopeptide repeat-containing protein beta-like [Mytilus trossulus]|uniref:small glutamine-rich tetratricopeptide repeat-containing protein beta-like n=1 Tax=Mytilus trossulus TaxID=6551 RepID=UPI003003E9F4